MAKELKNHNEIFTLAKLGQGKKSDPGPVRLDRQEPKPIVNSVLKPLKALLRKVCS
jgi:hypothetical protein